MIDSTIRLHERAACAKLCRDAGCICFDIDPDESDATFRRTRDNSLEVVEHDSQCPQHLAQEIEARSNEENAA